MIWYYPVETSNAEHEFKKIISLCRGETIAIEPKNREFYSALGELFENEELLLFHVLVHENPEWRQCFEST
jgi:hypothetical protein